MSLFEELFSENGLRDVVIYPILGTLVVGAAALAMRAVLKAGKAATRRPTIVFVSTGGTCRDPMAKVMLQRRWSKDAPPIRVEAAGLALDLADSASKAARHTIVQAYGEDLLATHRPRQLSQEIARDATLILTMTEQHRKDIVKNYASVPQIGNKTKTLRSFVGKSGDVEDPFEGHDNVQASTLAAYKACFDELDALITEALPQLQTIAKA